MGLSFTLDGQFGSPIECRFPYVLWLPKVCQASHPSVQPVQNLKLLWTNNSMNWILSIKLHKFFASTFCDLIFSIVTAQPQPQPKLILKLGERRQSTKRTPTTITTHHKLKIYEKTRIGQYLENKSCYSICIKPKKVFSPTPTQKIGRPGQKRALS